MGTLGATISSISSLASKLQLPGTCSCPSNEDQAIEKELNKLSRTLERIRLTLDDAEERAIRDKSMKLWLKELKQVAYDAEDVLDEYHYEVLRTQVEGRCDSAQSSHKKMKLELSDDLPYRIKETFSRFDEIAKDRIALHLREEDGLKRCNSEAQITPTSHMVVESNIFGREDEKEELINLIRSESNHGDIVKVVTIVGTGGLGKTTVAQLVYNDPRILQNFDLLGWVCASEDFNVERITKEVLESITRYSCDIKNFSVLQEELKKKIMGKQIFLVLDDVWNDKRSVWELFRIPFLYAKLVKILVTTRNESVAQIMQTIPTFKLGYLSKEQCWQLFRHCAIGGENCNNGWKLEIGEHIMNKCGRLPLAVKSIASLLRHEESEESWKEILESELWELEATKEIFPPLRISYSRLPSHLKPCLLYCSIFPKDFLYGVEKLTRLWHAQGYIELKGRKPIEEIGRDYVKQLFDRSFFEGNSNFLSEGFKLHDMIYDLARSNSENECYSIEYGKNPIFPDHVCHLYVDNSDELVKPFPAKSFMSLRTLIVGPNVKNFSINFDIPKTNALRALVFNSQYNKFGFLNSIGNLKHVRYISLKYVPIEKLPESICSLYNLQILTLFSCRGLIELPDNIGKLVSLQFLYTYYCPVSRLPESMCYLRNLKALNVTSNKLVELPEQIGNLFTLEELILYKCSITVLPVSLCQLKSLRILKITSLRNLEELPHEIGSLTNLQTLIVSEVSSLPPNLNKLTKLKNIDVKFEVIMSTNHDEFGWLNNVTDVKGAMFIIGLQNITINLADSKGHNLMNMHMLEYLMLSWSAGVDTPFYQVQSHQILIQIKNGGNQGPPVNEMDLLQKLQPHPNLKKLQIIGYSGITFPKWTGNPTACTSLEQVYLYRCENLVSLPFSNLQNLERLAISECHSLRLIQTEFVPSQLRELIILNCEGLIFIPGVQNLKLLVKLQIHQCPYLESLLKLPQASHEMAMQTDDYFQPMLLMGLTNLTSLRILEIFNCPKLGIMAEELRPVDTCIVKIVGCPNLKEWCLRNHFGYT